MTFAAKFKSVCPDCGHPIEIGDELQYLDGNYVHAPRCPESADVLAVPAKTPLCGRCYTYHRGEC